MLHFLCIFGKLKKLHQKTHPIENTARAHDFAAILQQFYHNYGAFFIHHMTQKTHQKRNMGAFFESHDLPKINHTRGKIMAKSQ